MSKAFKYIDIHGHVNFPNYDQDREAVIERAQKAGVAMITVGTDVVTSTSALQLATSHEHMWAVVGVHPTDTKEPIDFSALEKMAAHPKVVAIGECGLDYFHSKPEEIPLQKEIFEKHIQLAQKVGKPLMLHVRNGKLAGSVSSVGNAYQDALHILKKYPEVRANFHFFAGTLGDLKNIIERGYSVSFTGVVSFTSDYDELLRFVPVTQIMSETDCPFVPPVPYRGKRNEPAYVVETVKAIARIRGEDESVIAEQLVQNAKNFFRL
ncbi:MAG TPA: TatD family hydrolase [Candidatus Paceibacterota bacterium]|jgi:TatD DNase family protein|nr:TatD family hydrolase [Candidatus Paceibacterota bacterium]